MTAAIDWTAAMLAELHEMQATGADVATIAGALGVSVNAVITRLDREGIASPQRDKAKRALPEDGRRSGKDALPPGHPITWGAISRQAWP